MLFFSFYELSIVIFTTHKLMFGVVDHCHLTADVLHYKETCGFFGWWICRFAEYQSDDCLSDLLTDKLPNCSVLL